MVKAIESFDEFKTLIAAEKPVIIDFWATWCGPCKMIGPHFVKFADQFPEVDFYKVDVDDQEQIAQEVGIRAMPTFVIFSKGEKIGTVTGAKPADLKAAIEKAAGKAEQEKTPVETVTESIAVVSVSDPGTGACPVDDSTLPSSSSAPTGQASLHSPSKDIMVSPEEQRKLDLMNPATFVPPCATSQQLPTVTIEFCDRCRWLHRATWTQTELFLTFPPPAIKAITLIPLNSEETGGRFRVWVQLESKKGGMTLVWDRKVEGGFPEMKVLKQRLRDFIAPKLDLGHSDKGAH